MYSRFHVILIVSILLLMVFILTSGQAMQRQRFFDETRFTQGTAALKATASEIETLIHTLQDRIHIFAEEHRNTILGLVRNPDDEQAKEQLERGLARRFPHYFAFTITDHQGRPLLEDIESLVGDICKRDLSHYSNLVVSRGTAYHNPPWLHPQPGNYHFDIMAGWKGPGGPKPNGGVFFVSFHPELLSEILRRHPMPNDQMLLVKDDDPSLIEVTTHGSREQLQRDIRLNKAEQARIGLSREVPGTGWMLVLLSDAGLEERFRRTLWQDAAIIMGLALLLIVLTLAAFSWLQRRKRS